MREFPLKGTNLKYSNRVTWHFQVSCAQSGFVPTFDQISSYQAEISYESTWLFSIGRISSLPPQSLLPPGDGGASEGARDPTVAKLSPHHPRNSWQMYASVFNHTQCSMLTPFSPLPLNCSTIDHEGLRLRSFIGFQRGPSDCCYGLPNTCCCKSKPDPMHKSISECDGNPMCKSITGSDVCRQ